METFPALLAFCAGNSTVIGEFPTQRPVMRSFDVFFDLRLNKRSSKQSWGWWFETPSPSFWRHCNVQCYVQFQRTYLRIGRQLKRIESVRRSPVFAGFSETLSGLSSIRCYRQQQRFIENADTLLDDSVRAHFMVITANRYKALFYTSPDLNLTPLAAFSRFFVVR